MIGIRFLGWLLLILAAFVAVAMFVDSATLWLVVDLLVIAVCGAGGVALLRARAAESTT